MNYYQFNEEESNPNKTPQQDNANVDEGANKDLSEFDKTFKGEQPRDYEQEAIDNYQDFLPEENDQDGGDPNAQENADGDDDDIGLYPRDASNELSYTKMKITVGENHPREVSVNPDGTKEYKLLPYFSTSMGWSCCCKSFRGSNSSLGKHGSGVFKYFRTLKFLIVMFTLANIINIPMYILYNAGSGTTNETGIFFPLYQIFTGVKAGLSVASLGQVGGENQDTCSFTKVSNPSLLSTIDVSLSCDAGVMCSLSGFGLDSAKDGEASPSSCNHDHKVFFDQQCDLSKFDKTYSDYVKNEYEKACSQKSSCSLSLKASMLPPGCRSYSGSRPFFVQASCNYPAVSLSGAEVPKTTVGLVVFIFDLVFIVVFAVSVLVFKCLQDFEGLELNGINISLSDFTIQLGNLPEIPDPQELKAKLWDWVENQLDRVNTEKEEAERKRLEEEDGQDKRDGLNQTGNSNRGKVSQDDGNTTQKPGQHRNGNNQLLQDKQDGSNHQDPNDEDAKKNRIVDIYIGYNDYQNVTLLCYLSLYFKLYKLSIKKLPKIQAPDMRVKVEAEIDSLKLKLKQTLELYELWLKTNTRLGIYAFVQFRSMLDMLTFLSGFSISFFDKLCLPCRKPSVDIQAKMIDAKFPLVLKAPQPFDILWVNLGFSGLNICLRRLGVALICIVYLIATIVIVIFAKGFELQMQLDYNFNFDCGLPQYTQEQAVQDRVLKKLSVSNESPYNYLHCYCLQEYKSLGSAVSEIKFPDGQSYCSVWLDDYDLNATYIYLIAFIAAFINVIVQGTLRYVTFLEKPPTVRIRSISILIKVLLTQFINTVLVLILVYIRIDGNLLVIFTQIGTYDLHLGGIVYQVPRPALGADFPFFSGSVNGFTPQFYKSVGVTLLLSSIINMGLPALLRLGLYAKFQIKAWIDRSFTPDLKITKAIIQADYEAVYTGPVFEFDARYGTLMFTVWASIAVSAGMPLFYIMGFLTFTITYFVDKFLVLRIYQHTPNIKANQDFSGVLRVLFLIGILFHLIVSLMMVTSNFMFIKICGVPQFDLEGLKADITAFFSYIPIFNLIFDPEVMSFGTSILVSIGTIALIVAVVALAISSGLFGMIAQLFGKLCGCCKNLNCFSKLCGCFKSCTSCACFKSCCGSCCGSCSCFASLKRFFIKLFCCLKTDLEVDTTLNILNLKPVISVDFYREISLFELRLLYIKIEAELEKLDVYIKANGNLPEVYGRLRAQLRFRKIAVEAEIRARLRKLSISGQLKLKGPDVEPLDLSVSANLRAGLDAAIRLKGPLPHAKLLKGCFSYDVKFNPEFVHCLQMKEKLQEVRKILEEDNNKNKSIN